VARHKRPAQGVVFAAPTTLVALVTMNPITTNPFTSRLMGYLYCGIAVITLLAGGFLQASLWACSAGIWFATTRQDQTPPSPTQQSMAKIFTAAFILALVVYAFMLCRSWR
jgi:hypothetical protein